MIDAAAIARELTTMDREWLWKMPCEPGRPYPLAFLRHGLVCRRRRYFIFGPWQMKLNADGLALRAYLEEINGQ